MFNDVYETTQLRRPDTDIVNASVQYVSPDDQYEVVAGGTNITNDRYIVTGSVNYGAGFVDGTYDAPAEWYLTVRVKFHPAPPTAVNVPPAPTVDAVQPPPPAAKPEAQREFQVFFDFDKSDITDAAAKVIQAASDAIKAGNVVKITVTGHTDTVGSAKYNQALSERRAAAVKAGLVSDGVSGEEITTIGVGKTGLLVPTADGVREPQNRRAEIVLQ
jgi:outer membrane protein OmpA-like peptidoglycan-associated protein